MPGAQPVDGGVELQLVVGAVVSEDALDPNAEAGELGSGNPEGGDRAVRGLVWARAEATG